ncbi:MAG: DUF4115 domain-containing protein [Xanthomonadaceae bacterium]|nr:DUF4115 domain-containing protein [Xanthomonadaceae bacterium]
MSPQFSSDSTHQALAGCGVRLRDAREAAGLSIDDVAARLRMPARVVRSLEAEDWSRLGAPVFVRGQVRSYSRLLGLTTAPMMEALNVEPVQPTQLISRTHTPKAQWWAEQIGRRLVYIVLTLSLAIPAWVATRQHLNSTPATVAALDTPVVVTVPGKPAVAAAPRTVVASMAPMTPMAPSLQQEPANDVVLRASGQSWLEVVGRDGSVLAKAMLTDGAEKRFPVDQVQRLTIGNAAVVQMEVNGQPLNVSEHARANVARFAVSSDGSLAAQD